MDLRKSALVAGGGLLAVVAIVSIVTWVFPTVKVDANPTPAPPTTVPAPTECGTESGFLAYFATGNRWGPPVTVTDVDEVLAQLHEERCLDSAKTVGHTEYSERAYTSPEERARRTRELRDNPTLRAAKVKQLEDKEATAVKVEVTTMSDRYQTMYMVTEGHDVPWIYATTADRPTFKVLRFTYADGTWDAYKLDCDFQPVASSFPGVPGTPEAPPAQPVTPGTPPPGETPTTTTPSGGKDDRRSPVSDDPNDACEACRPNTPEPERPPAPGPSTTQQPTVPTPTTAAPPAPPPPTTAPPRPPGPECEDPMGIGICEQV